jgi:hypothetical protein
MEFSSLMFLRPTPPRMTRRNRLEHIFLLLLRCLAILILAFGFARPFIQKPMAATPQNTSAARIVLLVDTSASMRREGLWDDALTKARDALKRISPGDSVAVYTFDDQSHAIVSFEQWAAMNLNERTSLAAQRLAEQKPTWRSTHLGNAVIAASEALEDADKREQLSGPKRIVLITDLQEGSRLDGLQGHEWPRGVEVVVETVKAKRPTNAGLQWVMDVDDSSSATADSGVRLRVVNSPDAKREQFTIHWDGVSGATSLDAYIPPGQSRIVPAPKLPDGAVGERISLTGDDADFDNTAYVIQPKAEEVSALYLGDESEKDPAQPLYYLKRAFQDTRRQTVKLVAGGVKGRTDSATNPPPAGGYRLVIVSSGLSEEKASEVREFLNGGGTALFVMNDAASAKTLSQLTGLANINASEAPVANYAMFAQMDLEHPLLAPFSDPRFSDFTKVRIWKHRKLDIASLPGARVIATFDDHDPGVIEVASGKGRIFVFTFSWRPVDSQLALSSKFVPLLYSILDQAGGLKAQVAQYRVGDAIDLSALVPKSAGAAISIRKPDGSPVQLASGETRFVQTDQPGIYEVSGLPSSTRFAVNLDSAESRTAPLPLDELERLGLPMKPREVELAKQAEQKQTLHNADLESRQKLWRWLIVAAVGVLLLETWLAGWLTRRAVARIEATA